MGRRLLPIALVAAAAWADSRELHELAFYLLVAAVPAAAVCALSLFGDLVDLPARAPGEARTRLETARAGGGRLLVWGAAPRPAHGAEAEVPPLAVSMLVACILVFGAQALTALTVTVAGGGREPRRERVSRGLG